MRRAIWFVRVAVPAVATGIVNGCGGSPSNPSSRPPTGCVSKAEAENVWRSVDQRLNAVVLDPAHAGLASVATGNALAQDRAYIQERLVSMNLTEREVDRLDSLTVTASGCNGGTLTVRVTETLVQDDYLAPDGHVDHQDPAVGSTFHLFESFVRSGSSWKESDFIDIDQPSPTPQLL